MQSNQYDDVTKWIEKQNWDGQYDDLLANFKAHFERKVIILTVTNEYVEGRDKVYPAYHVLVRSNQLPNETFNFTIKKLYYTKLINQFDDYSFSVNGLNQYYEYLKQSPETKFLVDVYQKATRTKQEIRDLQKSLYNRFN